MGRKWGKNGQDGPGRGGGGGGVGGEWDGGETTQTFESEKFEEFYRAQKVRSVRRPADGQLFPALWMLLVLSVAQLALVAPRQRWRDRRDSSDCLSCCCLSPTDRPSRAMADTPRIAAAGAAVLVPTLPRPQKRGGHRGMARGRQRLGRTVSRGAGAGGLAPRGLRVLDNYTGRTVERYRNRPTIALAACCGSCWCCTCWWHGVAACDGCPIQN